MVLRSIFWRGIGQKILHIWAKIFAFYAFMGRARDGKVELCGGLWYIVFCERGGEGCCALRNVNWISGGEMVKRLHRAMLLPLCLSILLSAVPVHASEAGRGNSAVEAAVTEGETVAEEGGEAAAIEETAEVTEFSAAGEAEEAAGAAEEAAVTGETAETATEVAAEAEPGSAGEAAEVAAAGETAEAVTEVAAEVEPDSAGEAAEAAATGETVEVAAAGETTEVAASAEAADTAVAVPEVTTVAEPALKSTAGAVEKVAQMKLEVIDYLDQGFGDSQMLSSAGSRLLIDTYS